MVEYDLAKVGVAGSNPVSRSIFFVAAWPSGKAKVCKTFIHRFESGRRLHSYTIEGLWQNLPQAFVFCSGMAAVLPPVFLCFDNRPLCLQFIRIKNLKIF